MVEFTPPTPRMIQMVKDNPPPSPFTGSSNSVFYDMPMKADFFSTNRDKDGNLKPSLEKVITWLWSIGSSHYLCKTGICL